MAQEHEPADFVVSTVRPDRNVALRQTHNWASYDHRTLYESVYVGNEPGQVGALAQEWAVLGRDIDDSVQSMKKTLVASEEGWQGVAASDARRAIRGLADWSETAAHTAAGVGERIGEQGQIMATAKAAMPEPIEFDWHTTLANGFASGGLEGLAAAVIDVKAKSDQARAAHLQAVTVMADMEKQSRAVDTATPWFTLPPDPVARRATRRRRDEMELDEPPLAASQPRTLSMAMVPDGEATTRTPDAGGHQYAYEPAGTMPQGTVTHGVTPSTTPQPGMPNLDAHRPVGTAPQGALSASTFTVPNSAGPGGMPGPDRNRPGGTSPQGLPGGRGIGSGDPGQTTVRMPNVDAYGPGGPSRNSTGTPDIPPPPPAMPRNTSGGGGDALRRGWGPQAPVNLSPGADSHTQAIPRSGVPGRTGMAGGGMPGTAVGGARGEGAEDETHKSKYGSGERVFDAPHVDLPPSVIGGETPKREQG